VSRGHSSRHALPPFLTGAALAVVGSVAVGLLLYGGVGFIPALSVILAVLFLSLGVGVWVGAGPAAEESVDAIRRRWLLALVTISIAAVFAGLWEVFQGFGAGALAQGLGLALLGALPMYSGGVVLGALQSTSGRRIRGGSGPPALVGVGVGIALGGHFLFPGLSPTAILLLCLMSVSAAALLHGRALDREVSVEGAIIRERDGHRVRVERWIRGHPPLVRTAVVEGERIRVLAGENGGPVHAEEALLEAGLSDWVPVIHRALILGGGGGGVARRLAAADREREVRLVDPNEALLEAVAADLPAPAADTLRTDAVPIPELLFHGWRSFPEEPCDLVVLEWNDRSVPGALDRFPPQALERIRGALGPSGTLILFPLATDPARGEGGLLSLARDVRRAFPKTALYVARRDPEVGAEVPPVHLSRAVGGDERMAILVAGTGDAPPWPERVREFLQVMIGNEEARAGADRPSL